MKHPLSIADIARALAASEGETRVLIEFLYSSGARVSEACGLTWADLDLDAGAVRLQSKGGDMRLVPLGRPAVAALITWRRYGAANGSRAPQKNTAPRQIVTVEPTRAVVEGDLVFPGLTTQNIRDRLKTLGRRIGVHLTPHLFRHAFATHMLDRGADIRSVQEMLGHRKVSTTTDVYWDHSEVALHQVNRLVVTCLPRARAYLMAHPESFVDSYPYRASP